MKQSWWLIHFLIYTLYTTVKSKKNSLPLWSWECADYKCIPVPVNLSIYPVSLETCNCLCASTHLWPYPTGEVKLSSTALPIHSQYVRLELESSPSQLVRAHIRQAFELLREDLRFRERHGTTLNNWKTLLIRITADGSIDPRFHVGTDESYQISVQSSETVRDTIIANISGNSFCGVRHGLETLSQLIWYDPYTKTLFTHERARIDDAPKFGYRGIMLDTAQNFISVDDITRTVDAMAASKLNTLHWHITDSQSFPWQMNIVNASWWQSAYSPEETYTSDEIRLIVRRARLRGVRVLIEVDTPAHVGRAWSWASKANMGTLALCVEAEPWSDYCTEPPCGQLNPRHPKVHELLDKIYAEIISVTGVDDIIHLGGDDISGTCWRDHFQDADPLSLWTEYLDARLTSLENVNKVVPKMTVLWSSQLRNDLERYRENLVTQSREASWNQHSLEEKRVIISHSDAWELNSGMGKWYEVDGGMPYNTWQRVYEHRPWAQRVGTIKEGIAGGEALVWSDTLGPGGLDGRVWPRAAALAERLWTDPPEGATRSVHARLDVHRTRLLAKGIHPTPLWTMWCTQNPFTC